MKRIVKLDGRHKYSREKAMTHAVTFTAGNFWPNSNSYENWLIERFGNKWETNEWTAGWPTMYGSKTYYVAVKDPEVFTMMLLAVGVVDEN